MSLLSDFRIKDAVADTERIQYRTPIKFGGRVVNEATLVNVVVEIETIGGRRATGRGSMPMGNVWAWPSQGKDNEQTLQEMVDLAQTLVDEANTHPDAGHPLQVASQLAVLREAAAEKSETPSTESMPKLAQLVAASPLEAAVFDAYGRAHNANVYDLLSADFITQDLSAWLGPDFRGEYLDRYTLRTIQPRMPLYHLVGALDPLDSSELREPVADGLPETLGDWILADGLTHLKIKLNGDDLQWDVERVVRIEQVACEVQQKRGCDAWHYSLDFNEKCRDVQYVLDFLEQLSCRTAAGFERVHYIEQPTHRDLAAHPECRMHAAAAVKPVVIDESLVDLESLLLSRELGYSGVALKACKGHAEALIMGAAAQKYEMFLCVQDLTCPGASFLHSASIAARTPTVAAIEGNGRQYCPAGNQHWAERYPTMFEITDGWVGTDVLQGPGLGYAWPGQ